MPDPTRAEQRSVRKRAEILTAARSVFTAHGYLGTSMDAVAATAGASKRTVYQYFADKEELFASVVLDTVDRGYEYFRPSILALAEADDLDEAFRRQARITVTGIMNPEVLQMRRLVMAEADRFPDIGRDYYRRSWGRTIELLARSLARLAERGLLTVSDPERAAHMFTWLVVSIPLQRTAFMGNTATYTQAELDAIADEGARVFLAAHPPAGTGR
ncbi:AcrR family transcriptional regulator [Spinactinospora alkalitolerans]|uniref:AcrR family transcriptional regulator n=1 Tax=Spinactinospora alkalitolerans TaxID=687207 RepID=A0A852U058_9ACTN|nr:TetR/AcrR family transcriptional regulator [Spinactinospora alkalitolerans]NYE47594.1 AcrR family transcriptional regulator [Spinactinospora alkalitolerans]